jgi:hypothetical protein
MAAMSEIIGPVRGTGRNGKHAYINNLPQPEILSWPYF